MRPILFGVNVGPDGASFEVLFVNDQIDGDHQVATVPLPATVKTLDEARSAAVKQIASMTPGDFDELRKHAELLDRESIGRIDDQTN